MIASPKIRQVQLVGRKIRQLRRDHKLTQVELSSRLGIQQSDLSRMEKGEYRVSLDTLFRIVAEFKLSIGEFFDEVNQAHDVSTRALRVARDLSSLDEAAQREVEDFVAFKREQLERRADESGE
jgi:transcriptional regulator with XRE-family HTH domain